MQKTVIVTGANGHLGQAVVKKFLDEGFHVTGTVRKEGSLIVDHKHFEAVTADLTKEKDADKIVRSFIDKHGIIDAAILTVGGFAMGKIAETTTKNINEQINLNFETAFNIAKPVFLQMMKQENGRIFLIGSRPGVDMRNAKGMLAYSLSKSLLFRLAEHFNIEAKGTNVVTSVMVPSTIDTPENRTSMPDADFSKWVKSEEIASVIYYYCSPAAISLREPIIKIG